MTKNDAVERAVEILRKGIASNGTLDRYYAMQEALHTLQALQTSRPDADYVPGLMYCAKCDFHLIRNILYAQSGNVGPGDNKTEPCPNGCGPLWPVTWKQDALESRVLLEKQFGEIEQLRAALKSGDKGRSEALRQTPQEPPLDFTGTGCLDHGAAVAVAERRAGKSRLVAKDGKITVKQTPQEVGWKPIHLGNPDKAYIGAIWTGAVFGAPFECAYNDENEQWESLRWTGGRPHIPTHFYDFPTMPPTSEGV